MKNIILVLAAIMLCASCKKDSKSEVNEALNSNKTMDKNNDLTLIQGDFVYYDGAAVLQTKNEIYGVLITDKLEELNKKSDLFKDAPTDVVEVKVRAKITNEKHEKILWENKVEIMEIIEVKPKLVDDNNTINIGT